NRIVRIVLYLGFHRICTVANSCCLLDVWVFAAVVFAPFECCFFCVGVHPSGELDAGTTSACFDPLLTHRLPPSGRRGFLSNRRGSLLLLWGFGVRLPMRSIASLWRLLVALVLLRVVRRRPRRSRASGRILLPCIHTVRKAALRCRFLVSPQWSACVVAGQSLVFSFRFLMIRTRCYLVRCCYPGVGLWWVGSFQWRWGLGSVARSVLLVVGARFVPTGFAPR